MKCVIFAGGKGTRIKVEGDDTPKPLVLIGNEPIIWHIIKYYSCYGVKDFIICLGYKQLKLKEYFINFMNKNYGMSLDFKSLNEEVLYIHNDYWNIILVDTGIDTLTGGRLKRIEEYLDDDNSSFFLTYSDAVSNVDLNELYKFHEEKNKLATITVVKKKERFGMVELEDGIVKYFGEKSLKHDEWINAGFMVVNKKVFTYLNNNSGTFEKEILEKLVYDRQLSAYTHEGFWQCMDYQYEREYLNDLLKNHDAKWKIWKD